MIDIIRQLPDTVANQIAAGEVVQRPASALKELVENSVDAGATEIQIVIKDAGRTLIQVVDNGKGMSHNDARMAFERHATSKISCADDLFSLHTMGFRGEALASICAISQVELKTCRSGESLGTRVIYSGGHKEIQEPAVCTPGTNIMVRNLFFNVPARRKFLKSDSVELAAIMREFERLALVNNHLRMTISTGSRTIDLRAGSFKQRITDIWKNNLDPHLLPIDVDTSLVKISGFISRPEHARRRNPLQYLIVNGRNMRHPYFHKGILSCFEGYIATDTQPCYFLKFEVDPKTIDVNISPTKSEIKFENEADIHRLAHRLGPCSPWQVRGRSFHRFLAGRHAARPRPERRFRERAGRGGGSYLQSLQGRWPSTWAGPRHRRGAAQAERGQLGEPLHRLHERRRGAVPRIGGAAPSLPGAGPSAAGCRKRGPALHPVRRQIHPDP